MIKKESKIILFKDKQIRRHWDKEKEIWYFSIIDIIETLTQTDRPRKYWNDLKIKLKKEGNELSGKIGQLKMQSSDGKYYFTDVADTETTLRIVQSIPSPNAEPFKLWLAHLPTSDIGKLIFPHFFLVFVCEHFIIYTG